MARTYPLVSVVIPAYNSAGFLARAIDSVLAQDYPSKEVIVVDDGSSDDSAAIAEAYGPPVRVLRQENAGPDPARNNGIMNSEAEFIAFLDSDDEYLPGRLSASIEPMLEDPSIGETFVHATIRYPDGREEHLGLKAESHRIYPQHFWTPITLTTTCMTCRRNLLLEVGMFDRPLLAYADVDLWIRVRERSSLHEVPERLILQHARPESRSRNKNELAVCDCYFRIIKEGLERRPDLYGPHRNVILADAYRFWGITFRGHGKPIRARWFYLRALLLAPNRRMFALLATSFFPQAFVNWLKQTRVWSWAR